ncbi:MAG TPA: addiction module antidote protein [Telluria sp.]|nr:addiction module antidote protein [Telluria sp.]
MVLKLNKWDSAQRLQTPEDVAMYFDACLEEAGDDAAFIAKALENIARARGMTQLVADTGLGRESLPVRQGHELPVQPCLPSNSDFWIDAIVSQYPFGR